MVEPKTVLTVCEREYSFIPAGNRKGVPRWCFSYFIRHADETAPVPLKVCSSALGEGKVVTEL
jgi:hypothetical protein